MPTNPRGHLMRESGLTPAEVLLDTSQPRFAARLANACEATEVKQLHEASITSTSVSRIAIGRRRG